MRGLGGHTGRHLVLLELLQSSQVFALPSTITASYQNKEIHSCAARRSSFDPPCSGPSQNSCGIKSTSAIINHRLTKSSALNFQSFRSRANHTVANASEDYCAITAAKPRKTNASEFMDTTGFSAACYLIVRAS